ncbi:SRPBCC family protein [Streptomyces sp. NBC_01217]|uniref:SRPBCC family protein n=1 Tax=Streptomyces sp. NBC_01217 TaxID=2903779 RepID=UPI002E146978|nr:SRPBCC family protein [Streptomyces sp. NBC_01217]
MTTIDETVEIAVPVRTAYNQWTQFRSFPRFMTAVKRVEQVRPAVTHWVVGVGPVSRESEVEIVQQSPDLRIAWRSLDRRPCHRGEVTFRSLAADRTAVRVLMRYEPHGVRELVADGLGLPSHVVRSELGHFKEFIESVGQAGGTWRGSIRNGHVRLVEPERSRSRVPCWPTG